MWATKGGLNIEYLENLPIPELEAWVEASNSFLEKIYPKEGKGNGSRRT
jgi:hypothetical protein